MNESLPELHSCAQEPIRIPGAIQPHGRLVVLDSNGEVMAWSANWDSPDDAQAAAAPLRGRLAALVEGEAPAAIAALRDSHAPMDVLAHRASGLTLVEFEQALPQTGTQAPIYTLARTYLPRLQSAADAQALYGLAVAEIQRLTGFGRALLYRFDAEGHGEVLAERAEPGYDSFLGHRFPASDIPPQARELYLTNHIRVIPDARYTPVPIVSHRADWKAQSLDLSAAVLRSVSPVHLEYMRNMGTLASMSVSIVVAGRLWGLISCHDHEPRHVGFEVRAACEHLGRLLSLQIEAKEANAEVATRLELRKLTLEIVSHLADGDATLERLVTEPVPLLRMAGAVGAAVVLDQQVWTTGETPEQQEIVELAQWIAGRTGDTFDCDRLPAEFPAAAQWRSHTAGVLAIPISQVHLHQVLWFRPERAQSIRWAGAPVDKVQDAAGRLHPRRSFATWVEQVRGRSLPWHPAERAAAAELRHALIGIVLRRAEEMAEVAAELGRVNKELEAFSYTVSHDLRAPMRHIAGYVDLVQDTDGAALSDRSRRYLANVRHAAAYAGQLVDALLDFSRMGRAELRRATVAMPLLVGDVVAELSRQEDGARVEWDIDPDLPRLQADPFLMQVVVRNLLDNAVKYSRSRPRPQVRVRRVARPDGVGLQVEDNGVGFQQKYAGKLFGVFQRLHRAEDFEGTGIGLASVRRIVERHGGSVWAEGEPDRGAVFGFVLPPEAAGAAPPGIRDDTRSEESP